MKLRTMGHNWGGHAAFSPDGSRILIGACLYRVLR